MPPQIDFGKALSNGKDASPRQGKIHLDEPPFPPRRVSRWLHRFQLGGPEWANIIFTVIAIVGGLFSAFYFFNGADVVRSARHWPQNYFSARPVLMSHDEAPPIHSPAGLAKHSVTGNAQRGLDNPFSRTTPLIASNPSLPPVFPGAFGPLGSTGGMLPSGGNAGRGALTPPLPGPGQAQSSPGSLGSTVREGVATSHSGSRASHSGAMRSARRVAPKQSWLKRISLAFTGKGRAMTSAAKTRSTAAGRPRTLAGADRTRARTVRPAQLGRSHASSKGTTSHFGQSASHIARSGQSLSNSHGRGMANRQNAVAPGRGSSALSSTGRGPGGMGSNGAEFRGGMGFTGSAAGVGSAGRGGAAAGPGAGGGGLGLGGGFHGHGGGRR